MEKIEIEIKGNLAQVEISYKEVDASFDHEFGTEFRSELEIEDIKITSFENIEGNQVEPTEAQAKEIEQAAIDKFYN